MEAVRALREHTASLAANKASLECLQGDWKQTHTASTAIATKLESVKLQAQHAAQEHLAFINKLHSTLWNEDATVYRHVQNIVDDSDSACNEFVNSLRNNGDRSSTTPSPSQAGRTGARDPASPMKE